MSVKFYCEERHKYRNIHIEHDDEWHKVHLRCPTCRLDYQRNDSQWDVMIEKLEAAGVTKVSLLALTRLNT